MTFGEVFNTVRNVVVTTSEGYFTTSGTYYDHLGTYYGGANSPPERLDSHATFAPSIKQDS